MTNIFFRWLYSKLRISDDVESSKKKNAEKAILKKDHKYEHNINTTPSSSVSEWTYHAYTLVTTYNFEMHTI